MSDKPPVLLMLLRATFVFGPTVLLLGLFFALEAWPESPWVRVWRITLGSLSLAAFVAFFATRSSRKQLKQQLIDESSSNNQETDTST
jgi:hypothetical protein